MHTRAMVLVHDTSSQCAVQMYEVSLKSQGEKQYVSRPLQGGDIMKNMFKDTITYIPHAKHA